MSRSRSDQDMVSDTNGLQGRRTKLRTRRLEVERDRAHVERSQQADRMDTRRGTTTKMGRSSRTMSASMDAELGRIRHQRLRADLDTVGHERSSRRRPTRSATETRIQQELQTTHDEAARVRLRQKFWHGRHRIRRGKPKSKFESVLQKIQAGGWGKTDMQNRREHMTELDLGNNTTTNDRSAIATRATDYYNKLFDIDPDENDEMRAKVMMQYLDSEYDLWMMPGRHDTMHTAAGRRDDECGDAAKYDFEGASVGAEMVQAAAATCKRRKMCATDMIVSEVWHSLFLSSERWAAAVAWALNQRLRNSRQALRAQPHSRAVMSHASHSMQGSDFGKIEERGATFGIV